MNPLKTLSMWCLLGTLGVAIEIFAVGWGEEREEKARQLGPGVVLFIIMLVALTGPIALGIASHAWWIEFKQQRRRSLIRRIMKDMKMTSDYDLIQQGKQTHDLDDSSGRGVIVGRCRRCGLIVSVGTECLTPSRAEEKR
jgi:hypothetical protein